MNYGSICSVRYYRGEFARKSGRKVGGEGPGVFPKMQVENTWKIPLLCSIHVDEGGKRVG